MCGRYSIKTPPEDLFRLFAVTDMLNLEPRYNMAPMQTAPVIRERDGKRHMDRLRWGLVPSWAPDESRDKGDEPVETFTLLTTDADPRIEHIHHRMPVMLSHPEEFTRWLEGDAEDRATLMRPYGEEDLVFTPVSNRVGNVRNDDPSLTEPVAEMELSEAQPPAPRQGSLF
mgnify:CR=1 FL=1